MELPSAPEPPWKRDWQACPAIARIGSAGDIRVIGDVHGDVERLRQLLAGAEIFDEEGRWKADEDTLVFVGDFTGKYIHSLPVIDLLQELRRQAQEVGGDVIATMGNHEAEFLAPDLSSGSPQWANKVRFFLQELEDNGLDPEEVWRRQGSQASRELGEFLHCLPVAAKSEHWFFAHAGSTQGKSLAEIDEEVEDEVDEGGYRAPVLMDEDLGLLEARMKPEESIWWQRPGDTPEQSQERLRGFVAALGVSHLAVGHQAGKREFSGGIKRPRGHVFQMFDGTIYLTDVGMSRGQDEDPRFSPGAVLHIARRDGAQTVSVRCPDGKRHDLAPSGQSAGVHCPFP